MRTATTIIVFLVALFLVGFMVGWVNGYTNAAVGIVRSELVKCS